MGKKIIIDAIVISTKKRIAIFGGLKMVVECEISSRSNDMRYDESVGLLLCGGFRGGIVGFI